MKTKKLFLIAISFVFILTFTNLAQAWSYNHYTELAEETISGHETEIYRINLFYSDLIDYLDQHQERFEEYELLFNTLPDGHNFEMLSDIVPDSYFSEMDDILNALDSEIDILSGAISILQNPNSPQAQINAAIDTILIHADTGIDDEAEQLVTLIGQRFNEVYHAILSIDEEMDVINSFLADFETIETLADQLAAGDLEFTGDEIIWLSDVDVIEDYFSVAITQSPYLPDDIVAVLDYNSNGSIDQGDSDQVTNILRTSMNKLVEQYNNYITIQERREEFEALRPELMSLVNFYNRIYYTALGAGCCFMEDYQYADCPDLTWGAANLDMYAFEAFLWDEYAALCAGKRNGDLQLLADHMNITEFIYGGQSFSIENIVEISLMFIEAENSYINWMNSEITRLTALLGSDGQAIYEAYALTDEYRQKIDEINAKAASIQSYVGGVQSTSPGAEWFQTNITVSLWDAAYQLKELEEIIDDGDFSIDLSNFDLSMTESAIELLDDILAICEEFADDQEAMIQAIEVYLEAARTAPDPAVLNDVLGKQAVTDEQQAEIAVIGGNITYEELVSQNAE